MRLRDEIQRHKWLKMCHLGSTGAVRKRHQKEPHVGKLLINCFRTATRVVQRRDHQLCWARLPTSPRAASLFSDIRRSSREAFTARPMGAPSGFPEETAQILPDRIAARLTAGAGELDALCSNIGRLPDALASLGPYRTTGVATRAMHPGISADRPVRTTTHLSAYLCSHDDRYTLSLVGIDPDRFDSGAQLRDLAVSELATRGLKAHSW